MATDNLSQQVKGIVASTVGSFEMRGSVFTKANMSDDFKKEEVSKELIDFRGNYLDHYKTTFENIKDYPPCSLMFHVLGITEELKDVHDFGDGEFLECLIKLYKLSGVTEINEGV